LIPIWIGAQIRSDGSIGRLADYATKWFTPEPETQSTRQDP
jgi:hypothetical protein